MKTLAIALALCLLACNTLPVGFDGLDRIPADSSLTLSPDTAASYGKYVPLGAADIMYLGRDDDYESRIILGFPLPDSILDSIASLQLIIHPADSNEMSFVCRPCSISWSSDAVSWKMADSFTRWATPGGEYWHLDLAAGTFTGESLVLELDLAHIETLARESYGVILFPTDTGFAAIHSRHSLTTSPRIRISYLDDSELIYDASQDAHLVDTGDIYLPPQYLMVGSGVAFRSHFRFDIDSIPRQATIAKAELRLQPELQYQRDDTLRLGIHKLTAPFDRYAAFDLSPAARFSFVPASDSDSVAILDIRNLVQFWTAHPDSNFGLLLTAEPEWSNMFRLRIPSAGAKSTRLELLYVMPPEDRFR